MSNKLYKSCLDSIFLKNYRNFSQIDFSPSGENILIYGENGIGKTNILEAMSLIAPGRGLRNAKLGDIANDSSTSPSWLVEANVQGKFGPSKIVVKHGEDKIGKSVKEVLIDGLPAKNRSQILDSFNVVWLTPQMDQVFLEGSTYKKKFFDRMVSVFNKSHSSVLAKYSYLVRERMQIISNPSYDHKWVDIVERKIAETFLIIAEARVNFSDYLNDIIEKLEFEIPKARIFYAGEIEQSMREVSALRLEEQICNTLKQNRELDRQSGRTNASFHRSDLIVYHSKKNVDARQCSTGEQKSILISIFLGEVFANISWNQRVPVMLLDDIMSHLDIRKREIVFEAIKEVGAQTFVTAVDADSVGIEADLKKISIKSNNLVY